MAFAILGDAARFLAIGHRYQLIARLRQAFQAENLDRSRRPGRFQRDAAIVEHGAHFAEHVANDEVVAVVQRSVLHQHRRHRTASAIQLGFQHRAARQTIGHRLQVLQVGNQADHFHQQIEVGLLLGGDIDEHRAAAPVFRHQAAIGQLLLHPLGQGIRLVDLVDRNDDRNVGRFGVIDGFQRLRHHAVVSRNHQHDDVRDLRSASTHAGKRFVTRRVEEDDLAPEGRRVGVGDRNFVGADVLRDAAGFAFSDVGRTNRVEQAGLAMIDVAHDGDHRRTRHSLRLHLRPRPRSAPCPWPTALRR